VAGAVRRQDRPAAAAARRVAAPIRVWHGSATSKESVDLAARYGDPLFSANVTNPIEPYAELIRYYRERWAYYGHDPAAIAAGAGTAGYYAERSSQDAIDAYRPVFPATSPSRPGSACSRCSGRWRTSSSAHRP
jgi:alkanesulfonate monooxygenase SsuD/methylene tetrahydromethanopterin reductase-like flavin-dependent oxidoreductase (luciferase family)